MKPGCVKMCSNQKKNPNIWLWNGYKYAKNLSLIFFVMKYLLETSWVSVGGEWRGAEATGMIDFYQ